jgi:hypothetical protein
VTFGRPIYTSRQPLPATVAVLGPRDAMALTIAEYLRSAAFKIAGIDGGPDTPFGLTGVQHTWPDSSQRLNYPSAPA